METTRIVLFTYTNQGQFIKTLCYWGDKFPLNKIIIYIQRRISEWVFHFLFNPRCLLWRGQTRLLLQDGQEGGSQGGMTAWAEHWIYRTSLFVSTVKCRTQPWTREQLPVKYLPCSEVHWAGTRDNGEENVHPKYSHIPKKWHNKRALLTLI